MMPFLREFVDPALLSKPNYRDMFPSSGADLTAVAALADVAVSRGSNAPVSPHFQFCKALAEFRVGHYKEAVNWANLASQGPYVYPKANAAAVMAMAQFKLNQLDKARTALAECNKVIEEKLPKLEKGDLGEDWRDWIIASALRAEAKRLIDGEPPADEASALAQIFQLRGSGSIKEQRK